MGTATTELRRYRRAKRFTQEQLAAAAGVTARTIRSIEKGVSEPRYGTQDRIARALDCPIDDVFPVAHEHEGISVSSPRTQPQAHTLENVRSAAA